MKNIMLKIIGKQKNKDEEEVIEFVTEGKYYKKGDTTYLVYKETELIGIEGSTTTLKITDDHIKMKRFGTSDSEIEFQKGKKFNSYYNTPYGNIAMEILTKNIQNQLKDDLTGSLDIEYDISMQGLMEGSNKLNIQIMNAGRN